MTILKTLAVAATASTAFLATMTSAQVVDGKLIGNWKMDCSSGACQAFLNIADTTGNTVVGLSLLSDQATNQTTLVLGTPEMVALPPGTQVSVGEAQKFAVPFQFCSNQTCTAIAALTPDMVAALSAQDVIAVTYVLYGQQNPISYEVPINGFADAIDALQQ